MATLDQSRRFEARLRVGQLQISRSNLGADSSAASQQKHNVFSHVMYSTCSLNALKQPRRPAKESHVDVRFAMNTPLSIPISSRGSFESPLKHYLGVVKS